MSTATQPDASAPGAQQDANAPNAPGAPSAQHVLAVRGVQWLDVGAQLIVGVDTARTQVIAMRTEAIARLGRDDGRDIEMRALVVPEGVCAYSRMIAVDDDNDDDSGGRVAFMTREPSEPSGAHDVGRGGEARLVAWRDMPRMRCRARRRSARNETDGCGWAACVIDEPRRVREARRDAWRALLTEKATLERLWHDVARRAARAAAKSGGQVHDAEATDSAPLVEIGGDVPVTQDLDAAATQLQQQACELANRSRVLQRLVYPMRPDLTMAVAALSCVRLADGRTIVMRAVRDGTRVIEFDAAGRFVRELPPLEGIVVTSASILPVSGQQQPYVFATVNLRVDETDVPPRPRRRAPVTVVRVLPASDFVDVLRGDAAQVVAQAVETLCARGEHYAIGYFPLPGVECCAVASECGVPGRVHMIRDAGAPRIVVAHGTDAVVLARRTATNAPARLELTNRIIDPACINEATATSDDTLGVMAAPTGEVTLVWVARGTATTTDAPASPLAADAPASPLTIDADVVCVVAPSVQVLDTLRAANMWRTLRIVQPMRVVQLLPFGRVRVIDAARVGDGSARLPAPERPADPYIESLLLTLGVSSWIDRVAASNVALPDAAALGTLMQQLAPAGTPPLDEAELRSMFNEVTRRREILHCLVKARAAEVAKKMAAESSEAASAAAPTTA